MLETELRELFERQASGDQPSAAITSQQVIRRGRARLRIRRAGAVAAPLIAAGTIAAVVIGVALPGAVPARPRHPRSTPSAGRAAPKYFDPARQYPSFGWLPTGTHETGAITGTVSQTVAAQDVNSGQPGGSPLWMLTVYADGQCSSGGRMLRCKGVSAEPDMRMTTQVRDIKGLPAYWTVGQNGDTVGPNGEPLAFVEGILVFEYARDGWAELTDNRGPGVVLTSWDRAVAVRVAQHITFATSTVRLVFPVQLSGLPGWQLRAASAGAPQGPLQVGRLGFASGAAVNTPGPPVPGSAMNYPLVTVTVAGPGGGCVAAGQSPVFTAGQSVPAVIAGYPVTITRGQVDLGSDVPTVALQELCAADADGLAIDVFVYGNQPAIDVTQLFAHLRLLGPDPANWTTKPVA
jgi:hypothetical protein